MYTIGEISKIVKISTDTLRYYDEINLLKPVSIDKSNNYRYYSEEQLNNILLIMELKQYGFSLVEIKGLLSNNDPKELIKALHSRLNQLGLELEHIKQIMQNLHSRILKLEYEDDRMMDKKTVLIVDDIILVRLLIRNILEKHGYLVMCEASNGQEAYEMYQEYKPNYVIMDITMPVMDGIYATQKIREKDRAAKIIMCSGMSQAALAFEALKSGASDFVCKPFSEMRLLEGLEKASKRETSYDFVYLCNLLSIAEQPPKLEDHKLLNQQEMDMLITFVENKSEDIDINKYICKRNECSPEYYEDWYSLRESDAGAQIIKELTAYFHIVADNFSTSISDKTQCTYSMKFVSVEQTVSYDTSNIDAASVGILSTPDRNIPTSIHIYEQVDVDIFEFIVKYFAYELKMILSDHIIPSIITGEQYYKNYNSAFAQINAYFEILTVEQNKIILSLNIPHETAKDNEFINNILQYRVNRI